MATLHLGVNNVAYSDADSTGATTTFEVAEILEQKYHVMRVFYELNEQKIADDMAEDMAKSLDAILAGEPVGQDPLNDAMGKIEAGFRGYLDADEWQQVSGQVIAAAAAGVSHRFKKPKQARGPRPAFIDTGLYQANFRAWVSK
jgi:hypothetical protein